MADQVRHHSIPLDIMDDLASRFIINAPEGEKQDLIRMCFQVELAHWFYIDEYVNDENGEKKANSKLRSCTIREFAEHMFRHVSFLRGYADNIEEILDEWKAYKIAVPTYGAIILNEDVSQVLLVQGFWSKSSWGFPKGKVNEDEQPDVCAVREVFEETGFDIGDRIDAEQYLQTIINDQKVWLFLIPGVPDDTKFQPRTKNEIRDLRWFPVADLPASKKDPIKPSLGLGHNNLYMVIPFVKGMRKWISGYKNGRFAKQRASSSQGVPMPVSDNQQQIQQHKKAKEKAQKQRNPSSRKNSSRSQDKNSETPKSFHPKAWTNFHFKKKEIMAAITSTPGWT